MTTLITINVISRIWQYVLMRLSETIGHHSLLVKHYKLNSIYQIYASSNFYFVILQMNFKVILLLHTSLLGPQLLPLYTMDD